MGRSLLRNMFDFSTFENKPSNISKRFSQRKFLNNFNINMHPYRIYKSKSDILIHNKRRRQSIVLLLLTKKGFYSIFNI